MLLQGVGWSTTVAQKPSDYFFLLYFCISLFLAVQFAYSAWEFGRCIGAYHFCERSEAIVDGESFLKKEMASDAFKFLVDRDIKSTKRCAFMERLD
jgi:hypothetical protein